MKYAVSESVKCKKLITHKNCWTDMTTILAK